ncbi:TIGR03621 family F420-dependent LLM class oxidoreductase [Mycobacterium sp. pV006]|uniref:TIGR03621 family F420-dependent LLM class oxidoreductase n=1 Tax=Mycobacterium sp. pV006 TaxID=3238983 RepID=UPI00351BCDE1
MTTEAHRNRRPRFGLTTALPRRGGQWRTFAQSVEAAGVDVLTFADHLAPALAPFTGAAAAALATESLRVGTLVLNNDFHHPVQIAREAATLSEVSGDRFELGLGAGHMKSEYDAAGLRFDRGAVRVDRLVESVTVVRDLLAGKGIRFAGAHYRVHAEAGTLVPVPGSPVPLLIGGNGTRVLQLAGRVADIVGLAGISHNRDATEVRFTHFSSAGLAERIAVVRAAAGDRFEQIELNALIQVVECTKDRAATADALAGRLGVPADLLLDSPFVLLGTHEQMAETLLERQRRLGISYWTAFDEWAGRPSALPDLAAVIGLLRP